MPLKRSLKRVTRLASRVKPAGKPPTNRVQRIWRNFMLQATGLQFWLHGSQVQHFGPKCRIPDLFRPNDRIFLALATQRLQWRQAPPEYHHELFEVAESVLKIENKIGYKFKDRMLLVQALKTSDDRHSLYFDGSVHDVSRNMRLALLGDRALTVVVCDLWFRSGSSAHHYSLMEKDVITRVSLALQGRRIGLDEALLRNARQSPSSDAIAETFEAVLGAIYVDSKTPLDDVAMVVRHLGLDNHPALGLPSETTEAQDSIPQESAETMSLPVWQPAQTHTLERMLGVEETPGVTPGESRRESPGETPSTTDSSVEQPAQKYTTDKTLEVVNIRSVSKTPDVVNIRRISIGKKISSTGQPPQVLKTNGTRKMENLAREYGGTKASLAVQPARIDTANKPPEVNTTEIPPEAAKSTRESTRESAKTKTQSPQTGKTSGVSEAAKTQSAQNGKTNKAHEEESAGPKTPSTQTEKTTQAPEEASAPPKRQSAKNTSATARKTGREKRAGLLNYLQSMEKQQADKRLKLLREAKSAQEQVERLRKQAERAKEQRASK
ncbi:hypothetical protein BCR34DRAFT_580274 [Clohesyomyces aquaticus]|uniref:RNase III domain-containing protein n=1 Tax=Clohesyomyces aquaticus TaxID=1231657 RepID=A0A1Y1Y7R1_9PLEO|nr:hypothetical protein BCR34DRAFT_580274 [Clohesyomyces aquaticus]